MLILGLHRSRPMWGRPLQLDSSPAPASHSARVSSAITAPMASTCESFQVAPKFTGLEKDVGQYTLSPSLRACVCV